MPETPAPARHPLDRTTEWTLVGAAYAVPLALAPGLLQDASGLPKQVALALAAAALAGIAVARTLVQRAAPLPHSPVRLPLTALVVWAGLGLPGSAAPAESLTAFAALAALAGIAFAAAGLARRDKVLDAVMIAGAVASTYALGQYLGFDPVEWASHFRPRVFATLGNPVFLGNFVAVIVPLAFVRWLWTEREETRDLLTLLLALLLLAAYLSWTRSSWLAIGGATALQLGVLAATPAGRTRLAENRTWLLSLLVAGVIAATLVSSAQVGGRPPVPLGDRLHDAVNPRGYSLRFRLVNAEVCARIARTSPLLGAGLGSYPAHYPHHRLQTSAARTAPQHFFASQETYAHDDHLQTLAELGVPGLGLWIWFLVVLIRHALARYRAGDEFGLAVAGTATALALDGVFNFPLHVPPSAFVFACAVGLLDAPRSIPAPAADPAESADPAPPTAEPEMPGQDPTMPIPVRTRIASSLLILIPLLLSASLSSRWLFADRMLMMGDQQVGYNNYEMAYAYYGWGLEKQPLNKFLVFRYAVASAQSGRFEWQGHALDESLAAARKALALGYHDENVYKQCSLIYERKSSWRDAIRALDTAHALYPAREDLSNNLSYYLALTGTRLEDAIALAADAVRRSPDDPTFLDTLGFAYLSAGRFTEAIPHLAKSLAKLPANSPAHAGPRAEVLEHLRLARSRQLPK